MHIFRLEFLRFILKANSLFPRFLFRHPSAPHSRGLSIFNLLFRPASAIIARRITVVNRLKSPHSAQLNTSLASAYNPAWFSLLHRPPEIFHPVFLKNERALFEITETNRSTQKGRWAISGAHPLQRGIESLQLRFHRIYIYESQKYRVNIYF